jgi:hypothetical protein
MNPDTHNVGQIIRYAQLMRETYGVPFWVLQNPNNGEYMPFQVAEARNLMCLGAPLVWSPDRGYVVN